MGYLGTGIQFANVAGDTFTGDGSTTGFTLTHTPGTKHAIDVYLAGVWQHKSTFSISGTTLTFDTAPPNGVEIAVEYRGLPIAIAHPANDSVDRAAIDVSSLSCVVQVQYSLIQATVTCTTVINRDDTIPQQSAEGDEITTVTITPKHASNILVIEAMVASVISADGNNACYALFQDSTENALAATTTNRRSTGGHSSYGTGTLVHVMAAGTTSSTTFKLFGGPSSSGNISVSEIDFGLIPTGWLKVTEYLVAN